MNKKFKLGVWYSVTFIDHFMMGKGSDKIELQICGKFIKEDNDYYHFAIVDCHGLCEESNKANQETFSIAKGVKMKFKRVKIN